MNDGTLDVISLSDSCRKSTVESRLTRIVIEALADFVIESMSGGTIMLSPSERIIIGRKVRAHLHSWLTTIDAEVVLKTLTVCPRSMLGKLVEWPEWQLSSPQDKSLAAVHKILCARVVMRLVEMKSCGVVLELARSRSNELVLEIKERCPGSAARIR